MEANDATHKYAPRRPSAISRAVSLSIAGSSGLACTCGNRVTARRRMRRDGDEFGSWVRTLPPAIMKTSHVATSIIEKWCCNGRCLRKEKGDTRGGGGGGRGARDATAHTWVRARIKAISKSVRVLRQGLPGRGSISTETSAAAGGEAFCEVFEAVFPSEDATTTAATC